MTNTPIVPYIEGDGIGRKFGQQPKTVVDAAFGNLLRKREKNSMARSFGRRESFQPNG